MYQPVMYTTQCISTCIKVYLYYTPCTLNSASLACVACHQMQKSPKAIVSRFCFSLNYCLQLTQFFYSVIKKRSLHSYNMSFETAFEPIYTFLSKEGTKVMIMISVSKLSSIISVSMLIKKKKLIDCLSKADFQLSLFDQHRILFTYSTIQITNFADILCQCNILRVFFQNTSCFILSRRCILNCSSFKPCLFLLNIGSKVLSKDMYDHQTVMAAFLSESDIILYLPKYLIQCIF